MTARKCVLCFVAVGVLLPVMWFAFYRTLGQDPDVSGWLMRTTWVDKLLVMFWPSSILMIGDPEDTSVTLPIFSVAGNAALYAILGWVFWIGLNRSRIVLVATIISIMFGWYGLLRL